VERMREINFGRAEGFVDSRSDLEEQFTVGTHNNRYFIPLTSSYL
jgi:hypothetical protein